MLTNLCGTIGSELPDLTDSCANIGQIQKILIQRKYSSGSTINKFTIGSTNPNVLATWTTVLTATNGTKVTVTPTIANPQNEDGGLIEYGSGNEVPGGVPIIMGANPGKFTFELLYRGAVTISAFRQLQGETLAVYFVAEDGSIWGQVNDNTTPTTFRGIDIQQFKIGNKVIGGREVPDKHMCEFALPDGWDAYLYKVTPSDFNALTDLAN